jgi:hypothetical protein
MELARKVEERPHSEKKTFLDLFGGAIEDWYYQDIGGNPYIIAIVEGEKLEEGFGLYPTLDDPYFNWFRDEVIELCGVDLREVPTAASSEFIFRLSA